MNYATANGTAAEGDDYTATEGTLTFAPGETEKTVSVAIVNDTVDDGGETFRLVLSDPSGAVLESTEATGTILNSEPVQLGSSVSEPDGEDFPARTSTTGRVAVGGSATGNIDSVSDRDWFAVDLGEGSTYVIDLRGSPTGTNDGTLGDPYLHGIYDADGDRISNTTDDDGGHSYNSRVTLTATESGTHYIAAGADFGRQGTYTLAVSKVTDGLSADTEHEWRGNGRGHGHG